MQLAGGDTLARIANNNYDLDLAIFQPKMDYHDEFLGYQHLDNLTHFLVSKDNIKSHFPNFQKKKLGMYGLQEILHQQIPCMHLENNFFSI